MKNKLFITLLLLVILLVLTYFLRYGSALIITGQVPHSATKIISVDLRSMERHIIFDAIKHPLMYLGEAKSDDNNYSFFDDILIPRNLFLYTNDAQMKGVWFSSLLKLREGSELKNDLIRENYEETIHDSFQAFKKENFIIFIQNNRVLFAFQTEKNIDYLTGIEHVFNTQDFLLEDDQLFGSVLSQNNDCVYSTSANNVLTVDFEEGKLLIKGSLTEHPFLNSERPFFSSNSIASITSKIDKNTSVFKEIINHIDASKFKGVTQLSLDSVLMKWNGEIDFELESIDRKIDTIITYDYDDDFNKIEIKSTQELILPKMQFEIGSIGNNDTWSYLIQENAIQNVEGDTILTAIPLYQLYAENLKDRVRISTDEKWHSMLEKGDEYFFKAHFNIERYLSQQFDFYKIPTDNEYLNLLEKGTIELSKDGELLIDIRLKNQHRNFLTQLIKH